MNIKTRIHILYFGFIRRKQIFRMITYLCAATFLLLSLCFIWKLGDIAIIPNIKETYIGGEDKTTLITEDDELSSWIIYDNDISSEIFADIANDTNAFPVLATTIRPYSWMSQYEGVAVNNESERVFDIEKLLSEGSNIRLTTGDAPQVLIVHTHGTESYNEGSLGKYYSSDYLRSTDINENVVAVGSRVEELLINAGYSVIHDITMHDDGNYNGSYASSRRSIQQYLEEYPSIKIVLDIHRDTVVTEDSVKYRPIWDCNGKSAAQVMILLGSGGTRFSNDHWEENLKLSLLIQQRAEKLYPDLMRPILMRSSLYNQDLSAGGILVEVGTCGNTFSEAMLGAEYFTECLIGVLDSLRGVE